MGVIFLDITMGITSRGYWTDLSPYGLYHCLNIRAHLHCSHHGGAPTTGAPGAKKGHSTCCGRSQTSKFVQPTTWDGWTKSLGLRENSRKPRVFTSMFLVVPVETVFFLASILRGVPKHWISSSKWVNQSFVGTANWCSFWYVGWRKASWKQNWPTAKTVRLFGGKLFGKNSLRGRGLTPWKYQHLPDDPPKCWDENEGELQPFGDHRCYYFPVSLWGFAMADTALVCDNTFLASNVQVVLIMPCFMPLPLTCCRKNLLDTKGQHGPLVRGEVKPTSA